MTWTVGQVVVTPIVEVWDPVSVGWLLPELSDASLEPHLGWLQPGFVDEAGKPRFVVQSFLVRSRGQNLVVDTCVGNGRSYKHPGFDQLQTDFLERFSALCDPEEVDAVLCTHMHLDHVGWSTRREGERWVPTFPNARYLYGEEEWHYWQATDRLDYVLDHAVRPIFEAGMAHVVPSSHRVTEDVRLFPTPGHTPGHVAVWIESEGACAAITGDLMHHPIQCAYPDWHCIADTDKAQAVQTRRAFLERCERACARVIGTHFAPPTTGTLEASGDAWLLSR